MDRIAVIGGTSESVFICKKLENKYDLLVFAATEDGKRITDGVQCSVNVGRLDYDGFCGALGGVRCVVDASHPFARELSKNVSRACAELEIPYVRYLREKGTYNYDDILYVPDKEAAARYLSGTSGRLLFTTGAKTARFYADSVSDFDARAVMRVMDSELSHRECDGLGCTVIYENPPFSTEDNVNLIQKYGIKLMVSKNSGERGGVPQKADACRKCGIPLVLISAPRENGVSDADDVIRLVDMYVNGGKNVPCND